MPVDQGSGPAASTPSARLLWVMAPVCAAVFVAAADQTVVVTVLPEMLTDLRVGVSELDRASWTVTAYLIGYVVGMPLMGRLADQYGWPSIFVLGMCIFAAGSALVAVSPHLADWLGSEDSGLRWAVGARAFQAIGGGAAIPIALTAAAGTGGMGRQALLFGVVGASAEAGGVVGPLWGGLIGHYWSWEWAFWLNMPLVAVLGASMVFLARGSSASDDSQASGRYRVRVDYVGGALVGLALTFTTWALVDTASPGTRMVALVVLAVVTGAAAIVWVRRSAEAVVPRGLFGTRPFAWATTAHLLVGASLIVAMVTVPLMANTVVGATALEGGLRLLRMTLAIAAGAVAGGAITGKLGGRLPALAGLFLVAIGMFLMSRWSIDIADPGMTVHLALTGVGFGLLIAPIVAAGLREIRTENRASASSWITLARMLGMAVGLSAMTAWGATRFETLVADVPLFGADPATQSVFGEEAAVAGMTVFRGFFAAGAACALAALLPAWMMTRGERRAVAGRRSIAGGLR